VTIEHLAQSEHAARSARRVLALTQLSFFLALVWCITIDHSAIAETDGISFYGVYHRTILILLVGYSIAALGLWRVSSYYADAGAPAPMVGGTRAVGLGLFALLATPYNQGTFLNWTHMIAGVVMALVQLAIAIALVARQRTALALVAFAVQFGGGLLAAASLPSWHFPYLLLGEMIYEVGFGIILFVWIGSLARAGEPIRASYDSERTIE